MSHYTNVILLKIIRNLSFDWTKCIFIIFQNGKHILTKTLTWYTTSDAICLLCTFSVVGLPKFYLLYKLLQHQCFPCQSPKIETTIASMPHLSLPKVLAIKYPVWGSPLPGKTSTRVYLCLPCPVWCKYYYTLMLRPLVLLWVLWYYLGGDYIASFISLNA